MEHSDYLSELLSKKSSKRYSLRLNQSEADRYNSWEHYESEKTKKGEIDTK